MKKERSVSACTARHQDRSALSQKRIVDFASLSPQPQLNAWGFSAHMAVPECSLSGQAFAVAFLLGHITPIAFFQKALLICLKSCNN
jgi:hypothetical protein